MKWKPLTRSVTTDNDALQGKVFYSPSELLFLVQMHLICGQNWQDDSNLWWGEILCVVLWVVLHAFCRRNPQFEQSKEENEKLFNEFKIF